MILPVTLSGTGGGIDLALQADVERMQEEGKLRRDEIGEKHDLVLADRQANAKKIDEEAKKIGGFGIFNMIMDFLGSITGIIGDYLSPLMKQVSQVIEGVTNLAKKIYSLTEYLSKRSEKNENRARTSPR